MKPGPEMCRVLAELYEAQLDGRFSDLESGLALWAALGREGREGHERHVNGRHDPDF
jgi:hypothetical protein